jgi:hypothetical protein
MNRLFPITFSIPKDKILTKIPEKIRILSHLIPGNLNTYIYNNETDYYKQYQESLFAITHKKGGWDCMRHYEIMANGCIPYFPNIESCPKNTMALLPKNLILEGNTLYLKYKDKVSIESFTAEELKECFELIEKILQFTKENLKTTDIARYILSKCSSTVNKVLFLSADPGPDYLRCLTLQGFKEIFGVDCHDYYKISHIYDDFENSHKLYGKGITYTKNISERLRNDNLDDILMEDIISKKYDLIIYGSFHRGTPFYEIVSQIYKPDEIVMLCGEDDHICNFQEWIDKGHIIFVRELQ